jgi:uncharacterized protein (TIGR00106 family)
MIAEFSIFPIGKGESLSSYVAKAVDIVDKSGLDYQLTAMGTIVEGEWDEVMGLIKRCRDAMASDCNRLSITIRIDDRSGAKGQLKRKVKSVEDILNRKLRRSI